MTYDCKIVLDKLKDNIATSREIEIDTIIVSKTFKLRMIWATSDFSAVLLDCLPKLDRVLSM